MKKYLLLPFLLLFVLNVAAQTTYKYNFNNNLHDAGGVGPDLQASCTASYTTESLPIGVSKYCFQFDKGCGLTFNDAASFLSSGSYTVEMYVKLDTIQGYVKLIDYAGRTSDDGFYNQSGHMVLYPNFNSDSVIGAGQYYYIALTRDASTKDMHIYVNNASVGSYNDATDTYVYDTHKALTFFIDDSNTNHEDVTGAVAMIHISNYAMDSTTIGSNYTSLAATLNVPNTTASNTVVSVYPNPAMDNTNVFVNSNSTFIMSDVSGRTVLTGSLIKGENKLNLTNISVGMYLLHIADNISHEMHTFKVARE